MWAAIAGVALAAGLLWLLTVLISNRTVTPKGPFEQTEFEVGRVSQLADSVPFLLSDASPARSRDVYVQHLGDDEEAGWLVFSARAPGQDDRACSLRWIDEDEEFEDPCTDERYPADGEGLTRYPVEVRDGSLYADFTP